MHQSNIKAVIGLIGIATVIFILKLVWLPVSDTQSHLQSKLLLQYEAKKIIPQQTEIKLPIPYSTQENRLISQYLNYNGWRIVKRNNNDSEERGITFKAIDDKPGIIQLEYFFTHQNQSLNSPKALQPDKFEKFTALPDFDQNRMLKFKEFLNKDPSIGAASVLNIDQFLTEYQKYWGKFPAYETLKNKPCADWSNVHKNLQIALRSIGIPVRLVCGIAVNTQGNGYKRSWLQIHHEGYWKPLDLWPEHNLKLFALSKDNFDYLTLKNGSGIVEQIQFNEVQYKSDGKFNLEKLYNLHLLPLEMQSLLKILLTLPFAILIIAYLKTIFRIESYGNLTPALLGFALAFNELLVSLTIMTLIFIPTIFVRKLVSNKNKIVEHTVTLTFLILILILIITFVDMMAWLENPADALLPVVILALLIDKYFVNLKKEGVYQSNVKMLNTLLLSIIVIVVLQFSIVGEWLLAHPELHFITIALAILLCKPYDKKEEVPDNKIE